MRNEINLTDEQIEQRFDDVFSIGLTVDDLVFTRDTLEDFENARATYAASGKIIERTQKHLQIEGLQVRKGEQRQDLHAIDFGTVRAIYTA